METDTLILDTNIVSYIMKGTAEAKLYERHLSNKLLSITFVTVGELYFGAENANWGSKKRESLEATLRNFVVLPYDNYVAREYGKIRFAMKRAGGISDNDAWIAACAVRHDTPLVTHNARHFVNVPLIKLITEI